MQSPVDDSGESTGESGSIKPLRTRLQEARKRLGLAWEVLERDYILSWVLAGMTRVDSFRETLVFKGGTALKKCYFGDTVFPRTWTFPLWVPSRQAKEWRPQ